ncbi:MAG TPA: 4-aminobutyrate--2-oxoglutarate transaminase [Thermodesulforhabdus norvegica]|uniref:4-aminobutyrate--2-oxoglutarate transaminase n=1 Tax=Thermodesulforhabdus norvegica TaxID=39841 RepID=A0A7C0WSB6_9BACT|nr:4-aminobutyrate--2-oxoglutarate transaminase [Thermodesulforhabdus norvegica]
MALSELVKSLMEKRNANVPPGPFNVTTGFVREARGAVIIDVDGREIIDFAGGIGVMNVGHSHPKVIDAIKDQAEKYVHPCFHVMMYEPYVELAERLNSLTPGDFPKMTMFANSGAEAVENAVKIARYATGRSAIICFDNAFHGRTLLAMSLTSKVKPYKFGFGPFAPEIYRMPFAYCYRCHFGLKYPSCNIVCADYLEEFFISQVAPECTAAIIAEPIQGEGGFITPPPEYFQKIKAICDKYGILLIIDEVQSGMGRTGKLFAIEHWNVVPDIITMAKSLAAGMPLSAVTGRADIMSKPHVGGLGGTYGGNPVACRAALAVLEILLEDGLLQRAEVLGQKILEGMQELQKNHEIIGDVRGKGPMLAMELVRDRVTKEPATEEAKKLVQICFEKGLLILSCGAFGNVIRTLMPLVITDEQLEQGFSILDDALKELTT